MATVRRKTAADRKEAFRLAREQGASLSWNRYEHMLPQDGFARLGLACADCLLGPCRLNPFAREEERTVCGFTGDDLAYRAWARLMGMLPEDGDLLESLLRQARKLAGSGSPVEGKFRVGSGALDPDKANLCVKKGAWGLLDNLRADDLRVDDVNVVVAGGFAPGYATASSLGETEFLLLTGLVDAYVAPQGVDVARNAAGHAAVLGEGDPAALLEAARKAKALRPSGKTLPLEEPVTVEAISMESALRKCSGAFVVIGGEGTLKQTLDQLALDAIRICSQRGIPVVACGDAAVSLCKYGAYEGSVGDGVGDSVLCCGEEASALLRTPEAKDRGVALLPGLVSGQSMAEALALGEAGFRVLTATELPTGVGGLGRELQQRIPFAKPGEFADALCEILEEV